MNNREQFSSFSGMSPHERIEDMKRRFHENRHDPRMFGMSPHHDRMSPFFDRSFGNRPSASSSPQPSGAEARSVPINVQHQQQNQPPPASNQQSQSHPGVNSPNSDQHYQNAHYNPQQQYYEPGDDFYPPGFVPFSARDPEFFGFPRRTEFANSSRMREPSADEKVHHIPIHVESRPNSANHSTSQQHYPQNNHQQQPYHPPQQSSSSPSASSSSLPNSTMDNNSNNIDMTKQHSDTRSQNNSQRDIPIQVLREESPKQTSSAPAPGVSKPHPQPQPQQQQPEESAPIPMPYSPLNSTMKDDSSSSSGASKSAANTPRDRIAKVLAETHEYEAQVQAFTGTSNDKAYKYLEEMLTRCILKLDDICTEGNDELRKYRKSAVNEINRVSALLESKGTVQKSNSGGSQTHQESEQDKEPQQESEGENKEQEPDKNEKEDAKKEESQSEESANEKPSDKKDKKDKPKKKFFFIKSKKDPPATDTNNNAVVGKETAV